MWGMIETQYFWVLAMESFHLVTWVDMPWKVFAIWETFVPSRFFPILQAMMKTSPQQIHTEPIDHPF